MGDSMAYNHKEYMKEYRQRDSSKARKRELDKEYRERNKELLKERRVAYDSKYYENNPGFRAEMCANRRARKLKASIDYGELSNLIIREAYDLVKLRNNYTNISWHVDHIIPLRGKEVSGLHVGINLQVIPSIDNIKKSNKYTKDIV
jgi:hypothetical protein